MLIADWWGTFFSTLSMLASLLAAHLWFRASKIKLPRLPETHTRATAPSQMHSRNNLL